MKTAREKAITCNTLIGILKACEGKTVQIDLRNELNIYGKVESVEYNMNLSMSNAYLTIPFSLNDFKASSDKPKPKFYKQITIRGRNIRFVHIPDDIDMIEALQKEIMGVKATHQTLRQSKSFKSNKKN